MGPGQHLGRADLPGGLAERLKKSWSMREEDSTVRLLRQEGVEGALPADGGAVEGGGARAVVRDALDCFWPGTKVGEVCVVAEGPERGAVIHSDLWPEPVEVLHIEQRGSAVELTVRGTRTRALSSKVLTQEQVAVLTIQRAEEIYPLNCDAEAFRVAAEGLRIRLAYLFDRHFAIGVSQIDPLPHQLEAVYDYLLRQPRIRFLLADDPGAGKTIMAGLVLKELKYRRLADRILIVVPANLADQWRAEMHEKFGETFVVIDRSSFANLYGANPWAQHDQVITRIDFARQDEVMAMLEAMDVPWDLVIFDEAHKLSAYRYGRKTKKTHRYRLGEVLSRKSQHMLLMTATPHRGDPDNFRLLLDLLDLNVSASNQIMHQSMADEERRRLFFLRRRKEDMLKPDGSPIFPERHAITVPYELEGPEWDLYNAVTAYVQEQRHLASERKNRNVGLTLTVMQRRLASSVRAIARTLGRRLERLQDELEKGAIAIAAQARERTAWEDEEFDEDDLTDEEASELAEQSLKYTTAQTVGELEAEIEQLRVLVAQAKRTEDLHRERKLEALRAEVLDREHIFTSNQKIIIFTEHRDTLTYLRERLTDWGLRSTEIHGSMSLEARKTQQERFLDPDGEVQVLVATDAAGEGINLQQCNLMVNYDIPWNPNRLEQRMGRIHRYGQNRATYAFNLVAANTREGDVLHRLLVKIEEQRAELGDSVYDVVGDIINERELTDLIWKAIESPGTLADLHAQIDERAKRENIERLRKARDEGLAISHIDFRAIMDEEREARANRVMPEYVEDFFARACALLGIRCERRPLDNDWRIEHVPAALRQQPDIRRRYGEILEQYSRFTFHKERAMDERARSRPIFVAPGHPLFEAVAAAVEQQYGSTLRCGTVLIDPDNGTPRLLWMLRGRVMDGNNATVGERLHFVTQVLDSPDNFERAGPSPIVDLAAWRQDLGGPPPAAMDGLRALARGRDAALTYAVNSLLADYRAELEQERQHRIKEQALEQAYAFQIHESNHRLADYRRKQQAGRDMALTIQNEERALDFLIQERERKRGEIRRERELTLDAPEAVGVAAVLPVGALAQIPAELPAGRPPAGGDPAARKAVEEAAMQLVMGYERSHGRTPNDVSAENKGWDILSTDGQGAVRFIEVKGAAGRGAVELTTNEYHKAKTLGADYWLYVVWDALNSPVLHTFFDPVNRLRIETRVLERHIVPVESLEAAGG